MIRNVRPAAELPGHSRRTVLTITFGALIISATLLIFAFGS